MRYGRFVLSVFIGFFVAVVVVGIVPPIWNLVTT